MAATSSTVRRLGCVNSLRISSSVKPSAEAADGAADRGEGDAGRHQPGDDVQEVVADVAAVDVAGAAGEDEGQGAEARVGDARPRQVHRHDRRQQLAGHGVGEDEEGRRARRSARPSPPCRSGCRASACATAGSAGRHTGRHRRAESRSARPTARRCRTGRSSRTAFRGTRRSTPATSGRPSPPSISSASTKPTISSMPRPRYSKRSPRMAKWFHR